MCVIRVIAILAAITIASASHVVDVISAVSDPRAGGGDNAVRRMLHDDNIDCSAFGKKMCIANRKHCAFVSGKNKNDKMVRACIEKDFACSNLDRDICSLEDFRGICEVEGLKCVPLFPTCNDFKKQGLCKNALLAYKGLLACKWSNGMCEDIPVTKCEDIPTQKECNGAFEDAKFLKLDTVCEFKRSSGSCMVAENQCQQWDGTHRNKCLVRSAKEGYICDYNKGDDTCFPVSCAYHGEQKNRGQCKRLEKAGLCTSISKDTCLAA